VPLRMHRLPLLAIFLVASFASAQDTIVQSLFARFRSKSAESLQASLVELGIGEHARDTSKIVNITDSNWEDYLGPQSTGEWLVEFTVQPELCPSCELIDLAFNVRRYLRLLTHRTPPTDLLSHTQISILGESIAQTRSYCRRDSSLQSHRYYITSPLPPGQ
jgi:hypothetical protein